MATPSPLPGPPPPDPDRSLLSSIPVFEVVVGMGVLLAVAGVALAVVPALRRRRALVTVWLLLVGEYVLAGIVTLSLGLMSFSNMGGTSPTPAESVIRTAGALLAAAGVALAVVPALRRRRAFVTAWVLSISVFSLGAVMAALYA